MTIDQQVVPVRATGKEFAVPADRAGFQGHLLGVGNFRGYFLESGKHLRGQPATAELRQTGHRSKRRPDKQQQCQPAGCQEQGQHPDPRHYANGRFGTSFPPQHIQQAHQGYEKQDQRHCELSLSSSMNGKPGHNARAF